jgi:hypothetical protein
MIRRLAQKLVELVELALAVREFWREDDDDLERRFCTCRARPHLRGCPLYRKGPADGH